MAESDIRTKENVEYQTKRRNHRTLKHETDSSHRRSGKIDNTSESEHEHNHHPHVGNHQLHNTGGRMTKAAKTLTVLMISGAIWLGLLVSGRKIGYDFISGRQIGNARISRVDRAVLNIDNPRIDNTGILANNENRLIRNTAKRITTRVIERNINGRDSCYAINTSRIFDAISSANEIIASNAIGARGGTNIF